MTGHGIWGYIPSVWRYMTVYVRLSGFQMKISRYRVHSTRYLENPDIRCPDIESGKYPISGLSRIQIMMRRDDTRARAPAGDWPGTLLDGRAGPRDSDDPAGDWTLLDCRRVAPRSESDDSDPADHRPMRDRHGAAP
jgi:hypothetical protein